MSPSVSSRSHRRRRVRAIFNYALLRFMDQVRGSICTWDLKLCLIVCELLGLRNSGRTYAVYALRECGNWLV